MRPGFGRRDTGQVRGGGVLVESFRAATLVARSTIEAREFPLASPGAGALVVRVLAAGICGTDKHIYAGQGRIYVGTVRERDVPLPIILGHEVVARVHTVGPGDPRDFYGEPLTPGDRVVICPEVVCGRCFECRHAVGYPWCEQVEAYGNTLAAVGDPVLGGGFAESMYLVPGTFVYRVPVELPDSLAAITEVMAVTFGLDRIFQRSNYPREGFASGQGALVLGAGPVGVLHGLKARWLGATPVAVVERTPHRTEVARAMGLSAIQAEIGRCDARSLGAELVQVFGPRGPAVVVDAIGSGASFDFALQAVGRCGVVLEVGAFTQSDFARVDPHQLLARNVTVLGVANHPYTAYGPSFRLLLQHRDDVPWERFFSHRFPVGEGDAAMRTACSEHSMKVLIGPEF